MFYPSHMSGRTTASVYKDFKSNIVLLWDFVTKIRATLLRHLQVFSYLQDKHAERKAGRTEKNGKLLAETIHDFRATIARRIVVWHNTWSCLNKRNMRMSTGITNAWHNLILLSNTWMNSLVAALTVNHKMNENLYTLNNCFMGRLFYLPSVLI